MQSEFKYADLLDDDVFKLVFGRESSKDVMIEFLNQVIPDRRIVDLEFVDKEMHYLDRSRKDSIYDMFCKTDDGSRIVVEVQRRKQANFAERAIYYSTFSIANQVSAGAGCYDFYPVYVISILNFGFKPGGSKVKSEFRLYETDTRELLTDRVTFIFLDLSKFKKTAEELKKLNIYTIEDLARVNDKILERKFKNQAIYLKKAAWGIDDSEVVARSSKRDSISTTETLPYDYNDSQKLKEILLRQTEKISRELRKQNQYTKTVTVIFRNSDFQNYTSQTKLKIPTNKTDDIYKSVLEIFNDSWKKDSIRLIGVRLSDFTDNQEHQMTLFDNSTNKDIKEDKIQKIIDDINNKFGNNSVIPATLKKIVNVDKNQ